MMDKKLKKAWVKALRSGKYAQGCGSLKKNEDGGTKYCCLGVLCDIKAKQTKKAFATYARGNVCLKASFRDRIGMVENSEEDVLISMNDDHVNSFQEIADFIEAKL